MKNQFGNFIRQRRLLIGLMLRNFCKKNNWNVRDYSEIEQGKAIIEKRELLEKLAEDLEIIEHVDKELFFKLAYGSQKEVPCPTEEELRSLLPAFCRNVTSCTDKVNEEEILNFLKENRIKRRIIGGQD